MEDTPYWNNLLKTGAFRFERLALKDIDNTPIVMAYTPDILDQETCLFHRDVRTGDDYFVILHDPRGVAAKGDAHCSFCRRGIRVL